MRVALSRRKSYILAAIATIAAATSLFADSGTLVGRPADAAANAAPTPRTVTSRNAEPSADLTPAAAKFLFALAHRTADASNADALFAPKSWYVAPPPPPPPLPVAPPPPTAPPLPFAFLGSYTETDRATVYFLTRDDRVYDVKLGDTLDTEYTVDAVENGALRFTYKPLNVQQTLALGGTP